MGFPVNLSFTLGSSTPGLGPSFNTTVADDWFTVKVTTAFTLVPAKADIAIFRLYCLHAERPHRYVVNAELASFIGCGRAVTARFSGSRRRTYHVSAHLHAFERSSIFIKHRTADCALVLERISSLW